jgi:L-histidine N-alpha-methyltransferase
MLFQRDPHLHEAANRILAVSSQMDLAHDVLNGLGASSKSLPSRWFYDDEGSKIFQKIMAMPEYYPTRVEHGILAAQADEILKWTAPADGELHIVELGSGDGEKTLTLCAGLLERGTACALHPIDVSEHALAALEHRFRSQIPQVKVAPVLGSYFDVWPSVPARHRQTVLLLGSNLGNLSHPRAIDLLSRVHANMRPDDALLLGLDLQKDPATVLAAYNDPSGITAAFNLNLLRRLNRELEMDFALERFHHYASYSPLDGVARSFLVSSERQTVRSRRLQREFHFQAGESIYTEQSQKYTLPLIEELANGSGFSVRTHIMDERRWYTVAVLQPRRYTAVSASCGQESCDERGMALT